LISRKRRAPESAPLLAVVSLLFLLLPFLLLTTSAQKLVGLDMRLPAQGAQPAADDLVLEDLVVRLSPASMEIRTQLKRTDVRASAGEVEESRIEINDIDELPDLEALQASLRSFKRLAPERNRIRLEPTDNVTTSRVVQVMDAIRSDSDGSLFTEVALGVVQ